MAVRSRVLWSGEVLGTTGAEDPLYEAPAGYFVVVKSLRIVSLTDDPAQLFIWLEHDSLESELFSGTVVPGREVWVDSSWHVLPNGASVHGRSDTELALSTSASGAVLGDGSFVGVTP